MTPIIEGMTSAEYYTALSENFTELAGNCAADIDSFRTISVTTSDMIDDLNRNFRLDRISYGMSAVNFINSLNAGFNTIISRFQDGYIEDVGNYAAIGNLSEPSALVSDDGEQIDLWVTDNKYLYSTDGLTFSDPVDLVLTNLPGVSLVCGHVLKVETIYYRYFCDMINGLVYLATSSNKINFTGVGLVLEKSATEAWDDGAIGNIFVWHEGDNWFMLYEASGTGGGGGSFDIGLATASAPEGPWTKYEGNPVIPGYVGEGVGNPEMMRVNNEVIKHNGEYYVYYHYDNHDYEGQQGIWRAHSPDLHTWTIEGPMLNVHVEHEIATDRRSYGDMAFVQFKGKSYMFWSACGEGDVNPGHIDCGIDNRTLAEMLALYP